MGPFTYGGVIMDESPVGCWTNHQSVVQYQGQWYLFYHHNDYSPKFDKNRSIRADSLFFEADGTIRKVNPTLRGIGLASATSTLQLDRYSALSAEGVSLAFPDSTKTFDGWKLCFTKPGAWSRFNAVSFAAPACKSLQVRVRTVNRAVMTLRFDRPDAPVVARLRIPGGPDWQLVQTKLKVFKGERHDLFLTLESGTTDVDWVTFK
jgi:hypothetical protein